MALCARLLVARGGAVARPFTPRPPVHPVAFGELAVLAYVAREDERAGRPAR
ncbi:MAG: hypothetical protein M3O50_15710 [Myxococcota bacterium]|nr:hypothetical protein [Myxococcota bacterium]